MKYKCTERYGTGWTDTRGVFGIRHDIPEYRVIRCKTWWMVQCNKHRPEMGWEVVADYLTEAEAHAMMKLLKFSHS